MNFKIIKNAIVQKTGNADNKNENDKIKKN